jgi:hypothetical protein
MVVTLTTGFNAELPCEITPQFKLAPVVQVTADLPKARNRYQLDTNFARSLS